MLHIYQKYAFVLVNTAWSSSQTPQVYKSQCTKQKVCWIIKSPIWNLYKLCKTSRMLYLKFCWRYGYENNDPCPSQHHWIPHWKYVLRCCEKFPSISIPHQEKNTYATNTCSTISCHIYRNASCYNVCGIQPYKERTICSMCSTDLISITPGKVYTRKELVLLETLI